MPRPFTLTTDHLASSTTQDATVPVPVDLKVVLLIAVLNPVVIAVALWMGRRADQWQKLPIAAFAAAAAGTAAVYLGARLGMPGVVEAVRAQAGVFIAQFVLGLAWAAAAWRLARRSPKGEP